jgi:hypothetical protein
MHWLHLPRDFDYALTSIVLFKCLDRLLYFRAFFLVVTYMSVQNVSRFSKELL